VALGTLVAVYERHAFSVLGWIVSQWIVTAFQLMTHYANEYFDRDGDRLSDRTAFSGGSGVLPEGVLPPRVALIAALTTAATGFAGIAVLFVNDNPMAGACALAVAALAWWYSAPPLRLTASGFGEINTTLVVGILVPLLAFAAQTASLDALAIVSTLPAACAMFAMMICVEIPDRDSDRASGKRNLVVRYGYENAARLATLALAFLFICAASARFAGAPLAFLIAVACAALPAFRLLRRLPAATAGERDAQAEIAGRGAVLFATTLALSALGYAAAL